MIKFYNHQNCDIIGGPQKHEISNPRFKDFYFELEPKRNHGELVNWVATNNCFFSKKVLKNTKIFLIMNFQIMVAAINYFLVNFQNKNLLLSGIPLHLQQKSLNLIEKITNGL